MTIVTIAVVLTAITIIFAVGVSRAYVEERTRRQKYERKLKEKSEEVDELERRLSVSRNNFNLAINQRNERRNDLWWIDEHCVVLKHGDEPEAIDPWDLPRDADD